MIQSGTFYTLTCDTCGERMENGDLGSYVVAETLDEANQLVSDCDWSKTEDSGRLECLSCFEERDHACRVHECPTCGAPSGCECNAPTEGLGSRYCCDARLALEPPAPLNQPRASQPDDRKEPSDG